MAKMYPSVVQDFHNSQGEKLVYEALSTLNNDYTVFYSFRWLGTSQQYRSEGEADFLVLHPRKGIFKATGNSLLIKSQSVIRHIRLLREYKKLDWTADLFQQFVNQNGIEPLAAEFLRYKKLWLAFKGDATVSRIINKARKYSERCKYIKNIGLLERITWDDSVKTDEVIAELSKGSFYKRVVLANCLLYRQNNPESALYINNSINRGEDFFGFLAANENGTKTFYFMNAGFGDSIVACDDAKGKNAIKAMTTQVTTVLKLKDVLNMAGATVVNELSKEVDVDLSLDKVTKDTFINLL